MTTPPSYWSLYRYNVWIMASTPIHILTEGASVNVLDLLYGDDVITISH